MDTPEVTGTINQGGVEYAATMLQAAADARKC
jgi:hypothetical protein